MHTYLYYLDLQKLCRKYEEDHFIKVTQWTLHHQPLIKLQLNYKI